MSIIDFPAPAHRPSLARARLQTALDALIAETDRQALIVREYCEAVKTVDAAVKSLDVSFRHYERALAPLCSGISVVGHEARKLASLMDRALAA